MNIFTQVIDFPNQRVSDSEKEKPEWYANCCDWIISQGIASSDHDDIEKMYNILNGKIDESLYKKVLNPYNFTNDKLKRYPATMRNYDLMKGIIRRYVSEYIQNPHDFIVSANNAEVILSKNVKLKQELMAIVEQQIAAEIQNKLSEWINQGNDPKQFNPQEQIDIEKFIQDFNENYIDDISAQGSEILNVIKDCTDDIVLYARAYFDFVTFGKFFTYSDVKGNKLIKRNVSVRDAFPIPNDNMFAEDFDGFAERRKMTYQQIIDEFGDDMTDKDREFLEKYYSKYTAATPELDLSFEVYNKYFPDVCNKFSASEKEYFRNKTIMARDRNGQLYDVWHVVWRGERRMCVVKYINEAGFVDERIENGNYKINTEAGDIDLEYYYEPQVYECTRIGTRESAVYPYKARAIAYNRNGKLPYNGVCELLPGFGRFSIIETVMPYQVFYNIVAYEREMAIIKNKISQLVLPKSLLGDNPDATIHKMLADGVIYINDEDDQGMLRSQQIRIVNASYGDYIAQLGQLLIDIETSAKNQVDMTPQRYGEIANSAGKGVTEEAIVRGSMGSVIVEAVMDFARERDYGRDMDYSKLAWIDGLDTSYRDADGGIKYISLDVNKHIYADYVIKAKNSAKTKEKLQQLKQFAFNMGQNGDAMMAIAAITGDNIESIKKLIKKFQDENRQFELQKQENDKQIEQLKQEFELQKIQVKGEEDRKTVEVEGLIKKEVALINADANMNSYQNDISLDEKQAAVGRLNAERSEIDRQKLQLERQKVALDFYNKDADRKLKEKDIDTKLTIAKTNKNRYDKK